MVDANDINNENEYNDYQMANNQQGMSLSKNNQQEGRQSLIKLSPQTFLNEEGINNNQGNSNEPQGNNEEDPIEIEEINSKDHDINANKQDNLFELKQRDNNHQAILKNSTIKNIVGYKPKFLGSDQQLNDAMGSSSNIYLEEGDDGGSKKKVNAFNPTDDYLIPLAEEDIDTKSEKEKKPQKEEDYEINGYQYNDDNNPGSNRSNKVNEEAEEIPHYQQINQNNRPKSFGENTAFLQPNSITLQENMTLGCCNKQINNNILNDNSIHQQENLLITSVPHTIKYPLPVIFNSNNKLLYHHQKNPQVPLSRIQIAENKYLMIKDSLSKLFDIADNSPYESAIDYNAHVEKMLSYLDQLNSILSILVESRKAVSLPRPYGKKLVSSFSKSQLNQIEASNIKLLNTYEKQYLLMKARYIQISDKAYIASIQQQNKELDEKIALLEAENRQLRTNQVISENIFIKKVNEESSSNQLKKMASESERYQLEYDKIVRRIEDNQLVIKDNAAKIEQLLEREKELKKSAKEKYGLEEFDNIKQLEKKEKEKEELIQKYKKKIGVLNHAYKSNQKKFYKEIEDNQRTIAQLEIDRNELLELLHQKKALPSEATLILETNNGSVNPNSNSNDNNNNLSSINSVSVVPGNSNGNIHSQSNKRYNFNQTVPINQNIAVNKEMVIKELEKKQKAEEILHNMSLDDPKVNTSIVLKKIALKPNFSFNKKQLNSKVNEVNVNITNEPKEEGDIMEDINDEKRRLQNGEGEVAQPVIEDKEKRKKDARRKQMLNTPLIDEVIGAGEKEDDNKNELLNVNNDEEYDENEHEQIFEVEFDNKRREHANIQFSEEDD